MNINRRNISAIAKLDFEGKSHSQRIDAIAKALGYKTGAALMGALKAEEAQAPDPAKTNPIQVVQLFGQMLVGAYDEGEELPTDEGMVVHKTFSTKEAYNAYLAGISDADGWEDISNPIDTEDTPNHPYFKALEKNRELDFTTWFNANSVYVIAKAEDETAEDASSAGVYEFGFNPTHFDSTQELASSALDEFHRNVPIGKLEAFTFKVINAFGEEIFEADNTQGYAALQEAYFKGRAKDLPKNVAKHIR